METIKKSNIVEFDILYADGTSHRVKEGIAFEVEDNAITFHNGTDSLSVLFASVEAMFKLIDLLGCMPVLIDYLCQQPSSACIEKLRQLFSAEKQACFCLGQQDMQASAAAALTDAANNADLRIAAAALFDAVELIQGLGVADG